MHSLFQDLRVVEFATVLAGPSVGMFFAELGAEVVKIEPKNGGDVTRNWKLSKEDTNHPFSAYYASVNYGKESIFVDLHQEEDRIKCQQIIRDSDVMICNFKANAASKYQLDYEFIKKINPNIIYGEIFGFNNSNRTAYDIVLQAECGILSMNGTAAGELCRLPVAYIDLFAAHQLKEGILIAMLEQQNSKKAIKVSVALEDAAISSLANQATNWLMANHKAVPLGSIHPNIAPYGEILNCKQEKEVVLAIGSNTQFDSFCELLNIGEVTTDSKFSNNQKRVENRTQLQKIIQNQIKEWDREELIDECAQRNIPIGAVRSIDEILEKESAKSRIKEEMKEGFLIQTIEGNAFKISY